MESRASSLNHWSVSVYRMKAILVALIFESFCVDHTNSDTARENKVIKFKK
jgi:hypothetical protein